MNSYTNLQIGQRVWYIGDMANPQGYGEIVAIRPANKWGGLSYDILIEGERKFNGVFPNAFMKAPGRRFWTADEWEADRAARIEAFKVSSRKLGVAC